jgi:hypothetical protein
MNMTRLETVEERVLDGRKVWRAEDGRWYVEGWAGESYESQEIVEHLLMLERESLSIAFVNRKIVQLGGKPIPFRGQGKVLLDADKSAQAHRERV